MNLETKQPSGEFASFQDVLRTVRLLVSRATCNGLNHLGIVDSQTDDLSDEEIDMLLTMHDQAIRRNFFGMNPEGRLQPDLVMPWTNDLRRSEHILPNEMLRVGFVVSMNQRETGLLNSDVPILQALDSPVKCISLTNGPYDADTLADEYTNYKWWKVFVQSDGPPEIIAESDYRFAQQGMPERSGQSISDGGWLDGYSWAQQNTASKFKTLDPLQCAELTILLKDAALSSRA